MISRRRSTLVLALVLGLGSSRHASAQVEARWTADVAVGGATVRSREFFNNSKAAAHLAVTDRVLQRGRFAAYAEAGYDWLGRFGLLGADPDLTCVVAPDGGCEPQFPDAAGPSASLGVVYAPFQRVESRVGVGAAAYLIDGTLVGAAVSQADAAIFPAAHIGVTFAARLAVIPRYRHDRLTMIPLLLGLRVR